VFSKKHAAFPHLAHPPSAGSRYQWHPAGEHSPIPFQSAQCYHAQELERTDSSGFAIRNKAGIVKTYTVHLLLLYLIQAL
jgi:hypothetical protein